MLASVHHYELRPFPFLSQSIFNSGNFTVVVRVDFFCFSAFYMFEQQNWLNSCSG